MGDVVTNNASNYSCGNQAVGYGAVYDGIMHPSAPAAAPYAYCYIPFTDHPTMSTYSAYPPMQSGQQSVRWGINNYKCPDGQRPACQDDQSIHAPSAAAIGLTGNEFKISVDPLGEDASMCVRNSYVYCIDDKTAGGSGSGAGGSGSGAGGPSSKSKGDDLLFSTSSNFDNSITIAGHSIRRFYVWIAIAVCIALILIAFIAPSRTSATRTRLANGQIGSREYAEIGWMGNQ